VPEAGLEPAQCQAPPDFESNLNHFTDYFNIQIFKNTRSVLEKQQNSEGSF